MGVNQLKTCIICFYSYAYRIYQNLQKGKQMQNTSGMEVKGSTLPRVLKGSGQAEKRDSFRNKQPGSQLFFCSHQTWRHQPWSLESKKYQPLYSIVFIGVLFFSLQPLAYLSNPLRKDYKQFHEKQEWHLQIDVCAYLQGSYMT